VPEYGVWLEGVEGRSGPAIKCDPGEALPDAAEPQVTQFVWRGAAEGEKAALEAARAAWQERYGPDLRFERCTIIEVEPGDSGYGRPASPA
jgi:hypothetical protein